MKEHFANVTTPELLKTIAQNTQQHLDKGEVIPVVRENWEETVDDVFNIGCHAQTMTYDERHEYLERIAQRKKTQNIHQTVSFYLTAKASQKILVDLYNCGCSIKGHHTVGKPTLKDAKCHSMKLLVSFWNQTELDKFHSMGYDTKALSTIQLN